MFRERFQEFKVSPRIIPKFIGTTLALILLFINTGLFFAAEVTETAQEETISSARPVVFFCLILIVIASCIDGFLKPLRIRWSEDPKKKPLMIVLKFLLYFAIILGNAIISFHVIEFINNPTILTMCDQYIILGCGITFVMYLIIVLICNSLTIGMVIGNIFFLVWGIANYFVYVFRTIPLQWIDIGSIGTAMNVAEGYSFKLTWQIVAGIVLTIAICGFYLHARLWCLFKKWQGHVFTRMAAIICSVLFYFVIFKTDFLLAQNIDVWDWNPQYTYNVYGMESSFLLFAKNSYPSEPDTYSADRVNEIIAASESENENSAGQNDSVIPENIICVMNESFADLSIYPGFKTDTDVMPYFDSLTENTQKGSLMVSVLGGTTANTEYEFLTGNSMMLTPNSVAYNSYIKENQYSLAWTLAAQGYETTALHPYLPNGWNREFVYPKMGFDDFLSLDDFGNPDLIRGFTTDLADYKKITSLVENKEKGQKLFLFNVTMQNHSSYDMEGYNSTVKVEGYNGEFKGEAEQYLSLIQLSDKSLKYLIDYFSASDEKTLICFFGDHQPALSDDFLEYCYGKKLDDLTFEEEQMKYQTCYMLWANYDLPEESGQTLSANYLGSYLLSLTGLQSTGYNNFLMNQQELIPALNAYGYLGLDGKQHSYTDCTEEDSEALEDYRCLIYNELTGNKNRDASFFGLEDGDSADDES